MKIEDEGLISDLPPLDGDDAEEPLLIDDSEELAPAVFDDEDGTDDAPFDRMGEDEIVEDLSEEAAAAVASPGGVAAQDDDSDSEGGDFGEHEIDDEAEERGQHDDADEPGIDEAELEVEEAEGFSAADDRGEEGTTDAVEDSLDEELPALDADEDGDFEDESMLEGLAPLSAEEADLPRWADIAWERRPTSPSLARFSTTALTADAGRVIAAGEHIVEIGPGRWEGRVLPMAGVEGGDAVAVALVTAGDDSGVLLLATELGGVFASRDGGQTALGDPALCAPHAAASLPASVRSSPCGLAASGGRAWASVSGRLFESRAGGASWQETLVGRVVDVLAGDASSSGEHAKVALVCTDRATPELVVRSGDAWLERPLTGQAAAIAAEKGVRVLVSGEVVVLLGHGHVALSRDAGLTFVSPPGCGGATAAAVLGATADAPIVFVVFRESEGKSYLVRLGALGVAEVVAELGPEGALADDGNDEENGDDGRVSAALWDEARRVLWLGGPFGLVVWGPPPAASATTRRT